MTQSISDGIVLLAKQSGRTSFSSLWQIKNALGTKKIGHTGTLDSFADGLLVALAGRYTRLGACISDSDKSYKALVLFGSETDTLDPEGSVIGTSSLPLLSALNSAIQDFTGPIMQIPPHYSAVHVSGERASDRVRRGESISLEPRPVVIHSLELSDAKKSDGAPADESDEVSSAVLDVRCSKGTYVRSLARDIARAAGSLGYLGALRRTTVGPFFLKDAAGFDLLQPFGAPYAPIPREQKIEQADPADIRSHVLDLTPDFSRFLGLPPVQLKPEQINSFLKGVEPRETWFSESIDELRTVFHDGEFIGTVELKDRKLRYGFVAGKAHENR